MNDPKKGKKDFDILLPLMDSMSALSSSVLRFFRGWKGDADKAAGFRISLVKEIARFQILLDDLASWAGSSQEEVSSEKNLLLRQDARRKNRRYRQRGTTPQSVPVVARTKGRDPIEYKSESECCEDWGIKRISTLENMIQNSQCWIDGKTFFDWA